MKKKILAIGLIILLCLTLVLFTGCGDSDEEESTENTSSINENNVEDFMQCFKNSNHQIEINKSKKAITKRIGLKCGKVNRKNK